MDVMSPYARQFTEQLESPDIDRLTGLPPTVAIEQNMSRGGTKSTVGTVTEIWQFLRLLYSKLGQAYCPKCGVPVGKRSESEVVELVSRQLKKHGSLALLAPLVRGRKGHYADLARWAEGKGYEELWVDGGLVPLSGFQPLDRYSSHDLDLVMSRPESSWTPDEVAQAVHAALDMGEGFLQVLPPRSSSPELMGVKLACASPAASPSRNWSRTRFPSILPRLVSRLPGARRGGQAQDEGRPGPVPAGSGVEIRQGACYRWMTKREVKTCPACRGSAPE